jgi:hypothetical protein
MNMDATKITQIIYASQPFGFDHGVLDDILTVSRIHNARADITGTLICRADMYLQLIEGPDKAILETYARICADVDRHTNVQMLVTRTVNTRMFPRWAMRDDPPRSWMWNQEQVAAGAINAAAQTDIIAIFERLASEPA